MSPKGGVVQSGGGGGGESVRVLKIAQSGLGGAQPRG